MEATIFYSWQSDTRAAANRTLIEVALESAAARIRDDGSISVEPVVDRDTASVPGAPDIGNTIFDKIDASAAAVFDVTIVNPKGARPAPNPNVLIELGYALKALGPGRVILVQNTEFGVPERLPFDLRQRRVLTYASPEDASSRVEARSKLSATLHKALELVLSAAILQPREYPVELAISYTRERIQPDRHDYRLHVNLKNVGTKTISEWHVDVGIPEGLLERPQDLAILVADRSDRERCLLRAGHVNHHPGVIHPTDTQLVMAVDYRVDKDIFRDQRGLFDEIVQATAYVHGDLVAVTQKTVRELQNF